MTDLKQMSGLPSSEFPDDLEWKKAFKSNPSGNCVEIAAMRDGHMAVRDSKNPAGPVLVFNQTEWDVFKGAMNSGELG